MQQNLSFLDVIKQYIEAGNVVLPVLSSAAIKVQQELVKKEPDMRVLENSHFARTSLSQARYCKWPTRHFIMAWLRL